MICSSGTRELWRKINVLQASIKKVEAACYTVEVRGSEIPKHMLTEALLAVPDDQMVSSEALETHNEWGVKVFRAPFQYKDHLSSFQV